MTEKMRYTKYEIARLIGSRALQISMGAPFLIKLSEAELEKVGYNPIEIAKMEFEKGVLPITVRRPLPKRAEPKPAA
jgi:DNA-directed RNA polymerase subunit K/omega